MDSLREKKTKSPTKQQQQKNVYRHWNVCGMVVWGMRDDKMGRRTPTSMHSHMPSVILISEMLRNHEIYPLN